MARINPVYLAALSNPVPIPRKNKFLDERDIDKKGPTAVLPAFTNPYPTGSYGNLFWQSVYGEGNAGNSASEMESNFIDTSGNSPAPPPPPPGPKPRGKVFGRSYDADEINESESIGGKAVYSGGRNVGGNIGRQDKSSEYAPYKTQSEYAPPQSTTGTEAEGLWGEISNSLVDPNATPGTFGPSSGPTNMPNAHATVGSIGQGAGNAAGNWWDESGLNPKNWSISDRRLKTNIRLIDKSEQGYNIYSFKFIDPSNGEGTFQGVLSDEMPEQMVYKSEDGYDRVDYSMIDVEFKNIDQYSKIIKTNNKNMGKVIARSGIELNTANRCRPAGKRVMTSRDVNIKSDLSVDNIMYKGNVNLLAQD